MTDTFVYDVWSPGYHERVAVHAETREESDSIMFKYMIRESEEDMRSCMEYGDAGYRLLRIGNDTSDCDDEI